MDNTSRYCLYYGGVVCHVLCLWHDIPVWQHIGKSTIATSRHRRDMTSDAKATLNPNDKQSLG